ncbi:hypothetical protein EBR96_00560 [bacterium]|nr:hypothetical protein [bacterium]
MGIIGLYIGFAIVVFVLFELIGADADAKLFLSREASIAVVGGLVSAALINFPPTQIAKVGSWLKVIFRSRKNDFLDEIVLLLRLSRKLSREGRTALEPEIEKINDGFLRSAMTLVMNRVEPHEIKTLLKEMIEKSQGRHEQAIMFFESMAKYAPGLALIGTLAGLVKLLANVSDPKTIGPNMALALVCTFYGVSFSNLVFLPMAGRLKAASHEEGVHQEQLVEAIVAMASDELPIVVQEKLYMLITSKDRNIVAKRLEAN